MTPKFENDLAQYEKNKEIKQGGHLKRKEVKNGILEFILKNGPVLESDIRRFLEKSYTIKDQKTANTHLHDLQGISCIKQISDKKGLPNRWDIKTLGSLKNIKENFPNIHLMEYTKAKNIIIKTNFPGIGPRHEKKYFVYMSLFPSLFNTFLNNEFESMLSRAFKLWQINDFRDIINSRTDYVYEHSFLYKDWFDPSINDPRIEVSKDELQKILAEIPYPYEEQDHDIQEEIVEKKLLEKLVNVVLSKRPNSTKDQVQKEVSDKIIDRLFYTSPNGIFDIVFYHHARRQKTYDKICKHFYENDFICGRARQDAKTFVEKLEECIQNVNEAFLQTPSSEEPKPAEKFQTRVNELDALYDEWYEKCLEKDKKGLHGVVGLMEA